MIVLLTMLQLFLLAMLAIGVTVSCPKACVCYNDHVDCRNKNLISIPKRSWNNAKSVSFNKNLFIVSTLQEGNFSGMPDVKILSLQSCGIKRIEKNTFRDLTSIKEINLQENKISMIENFAFRDINLVTLNLDNNPQIAFENDAFATCSINQIFLRKCNLKTLPNLTMLIGTLKKLFLEQNDFELLPRVPTKSIFDELTSLGLAKNPLQCTCSNSWLAESRWNILEPTPALGQQASEMKARCHNPFNYRGVALDQLQRSDYKCGRPQFEHVRIAMDEDSVNLQCKVKSEERAMVGWRHRGHVMKTRYDDGVNELRYERRANQSSAYFECLAKITDSNNPDEIAKLHVRVEWPERKATTQVAASVQAKMATNQQYEVSDAGPEYLLKQELKDAENKADNTLVAASKSRSANINKKATGSRLTDDAAAIMREDGSKQELKDADDKDVNSYVVGSNARIPNTFLKGSGSRLTDQVITERKSANYMTDRRFTMLELIGAVIGTFTGTLLFFVLTCQFINWYKKQEKKRWSTHGPAYSQTYSTPHSHEYDVPRIDRIDQLCLPRGSPSSLIGTQTATTVAPMEFLDFKTTQRLHYLNNV